ncbi:hypothetical protein [Natronomonas marina]|uniref:hypothetical protein n=1 Tax=Natronomonas marina TaxID=2961939 RepID=UPI0020C979F3|nr:hypothetical protein [Natronomonas marina]
MIRSLLRGLAGGLAPQGAGDPQEADRETVAAYCGIERPAAVDDELIPLEAYRQQGGSVTCSRSGREPYPPETIVANYPLPNGGREVLSDAAYADLLADEHGLTDEEATALAYARAGWPTNELHAVMGAMRPGEVLASAREAVRDEGGEE